MIQNHYINIAFIYFVTGAYTQSLIYNTSVILTSVIYSLKLIYSSFFIIQYIQCNRSLQHNPGSLKANRNIGTRINKRKSRIHSFNSKYKMKNLMVDKRIVRGNTYAAIVTSTNQQPIKTTSFKNKGYAKQKQDIDDEEEARMEATGKRRFNIQIFTDQFVQSMTDKPPRYQKDIQTQFIIQKPIVRHYIPIKQGIDMQFKLKRQTQIWDGQLFNFDYEAQPLLKVLIGRTLQSARTQVLQEEELFVMKEKQQWLAKQQAQQKEKVENMQKHQLYLIDQNVKHINQKHKMSLLKKQKQKNITTHQKLLSRVISKGYLSKIKPNILNSLQQQGIFLDQLEYQLQQDFIPFIINQVQQELKREDQTKRQIKKMFYSLSKEKGKHHNHTVQAQRTRRFLIIKQRQQKARQKRQTRLMRIQQLRSKGYMLKLQQQRIERQKKQQQPQQQDNES